MFMWTLLMVLGAADGVVVLELNPRSERSAQLEQMLTIGSVDGDEVLDTTEFMRRLTGLEAPRVSRPQGFKDMLAEADRLEARFDSAGANAMRVEILRSYDSAVRITPALLFATARAAQNRAANALNEGQDEAAYAHATETMRRFPQVKVDGNYHNPEVLALFAKAREQNKQATQGTLQVKSTAKGVVHADGRVLGPIGNEGSFQLPIGHYRVWVETSNGPSFAREVNLSSERSAALSIDAAIEPRLSVEPAQLRCDSDQCAGDLLRLRERLGVSSILALTETDTDLEAISVTNEVEAIDGATLLNLRSTQAGSNKKEFSALYLLPLGVGQAAQKRYVEAGVYGAIQLGLGAWNIAATRSANNAVENGDDNIESLQNRQDLSAILFYSSLAASIIESVVVWAVTD